VPGTDISNSFDQVIGLLDENIRP